MTPGDRGVRARRQAWGFGFAAETRAAWFLRRRGYRILKRRFACPQGEIDIVARQGDTLVFVEVKARSKGQSMLVGSVDETITPRQRHRIEQAAAVYIQANPALASLDARFDALFIVKGQPPRHLPDAWRPGFG